MIAAQLRQRAEHEAAGSTGEEWLNVVEEYLDLTRWTEERAEGQGLAEYALILVLVSIAALAALTLLGTNVNSVLNVVASAL